MQTVVSPRRHRALGEARTAQGDSTGHPLHRHTGLRRSVVVMAVLAMVLILTLAGAVLVTGRLYRNAHRWTLHTYQVREQILQLVDHLQLSEMEARSYGLTGRDIAFQRYWHDIELVEHDADNLAEQVADNPEQVAAARQL
ncbi:MAG TPA: CHASE3 domain-containing protein, partial [Rhodanobacteraceae bacterium]|nr:CHASE3 domain-containing protein [Rhodanobacteraceae bacterium]